MAPDTTSASKNSTSTSTTPVPPVPFVPPVPPIPPAARQKEKAKKAAPRSTPVLLFPASPPLTKFLGPRLPFYEMTRIKFHPPLQRIFWNPCADMETMLLDLIRVILSTKPVEGSEGDQVEWDVVFTDAEKLLITLTDASCIYPGSDSVNVGDLPRYGVSNNLSAIMVGSESGKSDETAKKNGNAGFTKGTGYSSTRTAGNSIANVSGGKEAIAECALLSLLSLRSTLSDEVISTSCIEAYCERRLGSTSVTEIEKKTKFFTGVFEWANVLSEIHSNSGSNSNSNSNDNNKGNALRPLEKTVMVWGNDLRRHAKLLKLEPNEYEILSAISPHVEAVTARAKKTLGTDAIDVESLHEQSLSSEDKRHSYSSVLKSRHTVQLESFSAHQYLTKVAGIPMKKQWMQRLISEFTDFKSILPLEIAGSIFVAWSETQVNLMKALIIAPKGTPYSGGCFEFHIFLPADYPQVPPEVTLQTTGGGSHRFNPNLYQNGKVCLSLLGTWEGEKWNPLESSLSQVLLSIYALIFVEDPYFNEPGFQRRMNTPQGDQSTKAYNAEQRFATLQIAMVDQLRTPPSTFASIISDHFVLRKKELVEQTREWIESETDKLKKAKMKKNLEFMEALAASPPTAKSVAKETVVI